MEEKNVFKVVLVFGVVLGLTMLGGLASSAEKGFPNQEIEIVVPYAPGGLLDLAFRVISDELSRNFGTPIVIVNKPGGAGMIGTEYVLHSKPDGYTLLAGQNSIFVLMPATQSDLPYKTSDFIPIARYANSPNLLLVRKGAPWKTLEELIDYAKKNPGKLACGSGGIATVTHFMLEMLKLDAGLDIQHVPFKGGGPGNTAILGGHIDLLTSTLPTVHALLKSGDLRGLAITSENRNPEFPEIPTFNEKGYPKCSLGLWVGLFAPKGIGKLVAEKISAVLEKTVRTPRVMKKLEDIGFQFDYAAGEKFAQDIGKEFKIIVDVIKKANLILK
jgi:tripartite-type tricarboxylate transporter receptor subunit TctC